MKHLATRICALVSLIGTAPAAAQESEVPAEVHKRNDCRLAAQVLASGQPHTRAEWARTYIVDCEDEGPAYFSAQWASAPGDTAALRRLIAGSTRLRDARVYGRLRATAPDRSRPSAVRVAAMIALARYVDPGIAIDLAELRVPEGPVTRIRFRGGTRIDVAQTSGAQPLGSVTDKVLALLNRIAADRAGEPREIWYAAAVLARRIERDTAARARSTP